MSTVITLSQLTLAIALAISAWFFWQAPQPASNQPPVKVMLPANINMIADSAEENTPQLWRLITRRVISKAGLVALTDRLNQLQLESIIIQNREEVTMHAFDDAVLFKSREKAKVAAKTWQSHNIETNVIDADNGIFLLSLGRFYQAAYATAMQQRLKAIKRKFRYQNRTIPIPTWRFTFPPADRSSSEKLWRELNQTGVVMPILMSEESFQAQYGNIITP